MYGILTLLDRIELQIVGIPDHFVINGEGFIFL